MDELMHTQLSHSTNAFHAGQEMFESKQTPAGAANDGLAGRMLNESKDVQPVIEDEVGAPSMNSPISDGQPRLTMFQ